jgi:hypothetical protein
MKKIQFLKLLNTFSVVIMEEAREEVEFIIQNLKNSNVEDFFAFHVAAIKKPYEEYATRPFKNIVALILNAINFWLEIPNEKLKIIQRLMDLENDVGSM